MDLCNWSQDKTDEFDWTRNKGATNSTNTGPNADHTSGSGHYIYIEATGRNDGDTAAIISRTQSEEKYCLSFWYSMYGASVKTLAVYIKTSSNDRIPVFQRSKPADSRDWIQAHENIESNSSFQILIVGERGRDYTGDIAVDDIRMTAGWCSADCDFNNGFCSWTQVEQSDKFDWSLEDGHTSTTLTGPYRDHTTGNGHYAYIETSYPRKNGDTAQIKSPIIDSGLYCITFWYSMFGQDINSLRLKLYNYSNNSFGDTIFTQRNSLGSPNWMPAQLSKVILSVSQVVIEGVAGDGYRGDIAIDDVNICQGECRNDSESVDCTFESGICGWTQVNWLMQSANNNTSDTGPRFDHTTKITGQDLCEDWSENVKCEILDFKNGEVCYTYEKIWGFWQSSSATFACSPLYELSGSEQLDCKRLHFKYDWDGKIPTCEIKATNSTISLTVSLSSRTRTIPTSFTLPSTTTTEKIIPTSTTLFSTTSTTIKISSSTTLAFTTSTAKTTSSTRNSSLQISTKNTKNDAKDADNSLAVSVAVPIVVVFTLVTSVTVFVAWRRRPFNNCWSVKQSVEVHSPSAVANLAYEDHPKEKLDIQVIENGKKDKTVYENPIKIVDNNVYYEISVKEEEPKHDYAHLAASHSEFVDPKYSHIKESEINRHIADVTYSHINNISSLHNQNNSLNSGDETTRNGDKEKQENLPDPEYDHAVSGNRDVEPSGPEQYSHLNQVDLKRGRTGKYTNYDYAETGQEDNNCGKIAENNYFILEKEETDNQSTPQLDANSHDYFVLEKIEHCT